MKCTQMLVHLFLCLGFVRGAAHTVAIQKHVATVNESPIARVVQLITELKQHVEDDGKEEQSTYDKFACWCEETTARKAQAIETAKTSIEDLQSAITKAKAEIAAHEVEIASLKKSIKENLVSQNEATEMRAKENAEYEKAKTEFESCIGALTAAITVLDGAGTGKKTGFLGTLQEAQVLGIVAGVKKVLKSSVTAKSLSSGDLEAVDQFVREPKDFVGSHLSGFVSAAQVEHNPFGDYAPQSTRIQGILKELLETFKSDLKTATEEEEAAVAEFKSLMATKQREAATLSKTLELQEASAASKAEQLAEDKTTLDDTAEQLAADEAFFEETKSACKDKAKEWSERSRLRIEELAGINQAISILSSPEAVEIFANSSATFFLQMHSCSNGDRRKKAYSALRKLSMRFPSMSLAKIAAAVNMGGHFDKVIAMIDEMIKDLRTEEAEDITHRDLCQMKQNANTNEMSDLEHDIDKAKKEMERQSNNIDALQTEIEALETDIGKSKADLKKLLDTRNQEVADFKQALTDDTNAVALLEKTIVAMTKFYTDNKLSLDMMQLKEKPEYTTDPDKAPETWSSPYTGLSSESGGIVGILKMIKEDIVKEIKTSKAADAEAQAKYLKMRADLEGVLESQMALKVTKEKAKSSLEGEKADASDFKDGKDKDLANEKELKDALSLDCEWVKQTFKSRRDKRKLEMDGLVEAKAFLAGIDAGQPELAPGLV